MKLFLFGFVLLFSFASYSADEVMFYEMNESELWHEYRGTYQDFEINEELGRAWVSITLIPGRHQSGMRAYRNAKVPGLSFDKTSQKIVWDFQGQLVECADVVKKGRGIFRRTIIKPTGTCVIDERKVTVVEDDGFNTYRVQKRQYFLMKK